MHAYLILAHKVDVVFKSLLNAIDNEENDIFIHMDGKTKEYSENEVRRLCKKSKVYFTKRVDIYWGHPSIVTAELLLLTMASKVGNYQYIHLLSGSDLPIKSQQYIHSYFEKEYPRQFITIEGEIYQFRVNKIHIGLKLKYPSSVISKYCEKIEMKLWPFFNRAAKRNVLKTSQWFSITGECAKWLVNKKKEILRYCRWTECVDEMFLGTFLKESPFWKDVYKKEISKDGNMRYIDWSKDLQGHPAVLTMKDYEKLISSSSCFARKFDANVDERVIQKIVEYIAKKENKGVKQI